MKKSFFCISLLSVFVLRKSGIYIDSLAICFRLSFTCWFADGLIGECFTVNLIFWYSLMECRMKFDQMFS